MARQQAVALDEAREGQDFRRSEPAPPILQSVQVVQSSAGAALALSDDAPGRDGFRRSEPASPLVQPVQIVGTVFSGNAQAGTAQSLAETTPETSIALKEPDYNDEIGDTPDPEQPGEEAGVRLPLDNQEMYRIIREVAVSDSGDARYEAISTAQPEFGLAFGLLLFTQSSGHLGSVLRLMKQRDAARFGEILGPDSESLLATTNASSTEGRMKSVAGQPLTGSVWTERFRKAGAEAVFQAAQNEEAIEKLFRPMLNVAVGLGFTTDRALAMVFDRVVTKGLGGGLRWVVQTAGPLRTPMQREHALEMLDLDDLQRFQTEVGWIRRTGVFGPDTHAALVGALRRAGEVTLPSVQDLMGRLVSAGEGVAKRRLLRLRDSQALQDVTYDLV